MKITSWFVRYCFALLVCSGFSLLLPIAQAGPKKILLVGSNAAPADLTPLRYTHHDVEKMAEVLHELGGVKGKDIMILQDPSKAVLERTLADLRQNVTPDTQILFYYSGHADQSGLLLGKEKFPLHKVRAFLDDKRAKIRLGIIDACQSGALVRKKGGERLPKVDIRLAVEPSLSGAVLITSSSAGEASLEMDELGGSLFTHFLVSGLRGAADNNQDGMVTLEEAFAYSSAQTLNHSSISKAGTQHPTFEYNLSGQRQLVMTVLNQTSALIFGPQLRGSFLIFDRSRNRVVAELDKTAGVSRTVQLPPGDYYIKKRLPNAVLMQKISLSSQQNIQVEEHRMHTVPYAEDVTKGRPSRIFQPSWKYGAPFLEGTAHTMRRKEKLISFKSFAYGLSDDVTLFSSFFVPSLHTRFRLLHNNNITISLSSGYSVDVFSFRDERYQGIFLTTGSAISWTAHPALMLSSGIEWELESWNKDESTADSLYSLWGSAGWLPSENNLLQVVGSGTSNASFDAVSRSYSIQVLLAHRWQKLRASGGITYMVFDDEQLWSPTADVWWRW